VGKVVPLIATLPTMHGFMVAVYLMQSMSNINTVQGIFAHFKCF